jgi:carbon storage regulator
MLVIRRRLGESVMIGDDVEVTVVEVTGSRVKLGIRAPARVAILRKEIHSENVAAARGAASPDGVGLVLETLRRLPPASAGAHSTGKSVTPGEVANSV